MSTFADWARSGIGVRATASPGAQRASVSVTAAWSVSVGVTSSAESFTKAVPLVGPGDVVGIDPAQLAAVFPADGTLTAAPEELAFVEFHTDDLPWRYTPGAAAAGVALQPWVGLLVLPAADPTGPVRELGEGRRAVEVPTGQRPTGVDWSLWAHVEGKRSRLVGPRVLEPNTRYVACVVPTFEAGRLAGLGQAPGTASGAWSTTQGSLLVPVYASWTFTTGPGGTFEQLARRLRPLDRAARADLGSRPVDTTTLGEPGQPSTPAHSTTFGGVLAVGRAPRPAADARVAALLTGDALDPPVYGRWHAGAAVPSSPGATWPSWLGTLNRSPALRAAAAVGVRVVSRRQEEFMRAAWDQAGDLRTANALLRFAQAGIAVTSTIMAKRIAPLDPLERWQVLAGHLDRVRRAPLDPMTVAAELAELPVAPLLSGHWRRALRPRGPLVRRLERRWRNPDVPRAWDPGDLLVGLGTGNVTPPLYVAAGITGIVSAMRRAGGFNDTDLDGLAQALTPFQRVGGAAAPAAVLTSARVDALDRRLATELAPALTIAARVAGRVQISPDGAVSSGEVSSIMASPRIPVPMYAELVSEDRDWLLPGLAALTADTVALATTNQQVIEAFLVGMNHAMAGELLWRGFPTDQRGTVFSHFWPSRPDTTTGQITAEISDLHTWPRRSALGRHRPGRAAGLTVLLVRGELLRRFPDAQLVLVSPAADGSPSTVVGDSLQPEFRAWVDPDLTLVGFALPSSQARARYLLLSEPKLGRRFRLPNPPGNTPVPVSATGWIISLPGATGSAQVAAALVARQFRLFIHGSRLLTR